MPYICEKCFELLHHIITQSLHQNVYTPEDHNIILLEVYSTLSTYTYVLACTITTTKLYRCYHSPNSSHSHFHSLPNVCHVLHESWADNFTSPGKFLMKICNSFFTVNTHTSCENASFLNGRFNRMPPHIRFFSFNVL